MNIEAQGVLMGISSTFARARTGGLGLLGSRAGGGKVI